MKTLALLTSALLLSQAGARTSRVEDLYGSIPDLGEDR